MVLAACLLKLGSYGIARFFGLFSAFFELFFTLGALSMLFASVRCFFSCDVKSLIAFSRIFHMSSVLCGFVSAWEGSLVGNLFLSCAHGFVSALLFFLVGVGYEEKGIRSFVLFGSFTVFLLGVLFLLGLFLNSRIPFSLPFFSEVLVLSHQFFWFFPAFLLVFVVQFLGGVFTVFLVFFLRLKVLGQDGFSLKVLRQGILLFYLYWTVIF